MVAFAIKIPQISSPGIVQNCQHYQELTENTFCDSLTQSSTLKSLIFNNSVSQSKRIVNDIYKNHTAALDPPLSQQMLVKMMMPIFVH